MTTKIQWKRLDGTAGQNPKPRHGHRAVAVKDLIIVFGGGNEGIVEDLNVYNCATNQWFQPLVKGEIPTGCAAFGFATDGTRILVFGGMVEYGKYSSDLWELNPLKWEWKKLKPRPVRTTTALPCARLGHTLTYADGKFYLFGGLANDSRDPKQNIPRYLNDLYALEFKGSICSWEQPVTRGSQPVERESHSCIAYHGQNDNRSRLIIYGGMNGHRLGDLWSFHIDISQWTQIQPTGLQPQPRSLHSAVVLGHRMFIFGGWVPLVSLDKQDYGNEKEWKCTNTLASFNLETNSWELLAQETCDIHVPRARAGHCAVSVNTRMYIWSGRDGYRKAWNNQVCCKDLWCLETACPGEAEKVQLLKAGIQNLEVSWNPVPAADSYVLQIQRVDTPVETTTPTVPLPLQSMFSTKSPQSVLASMIPNFEKPSASMSNPSISAISDPTDASHECTPQNTSGNTNPNTSFVFQKSIPTVRPSTTTQTIQLINNTVTNATIRPLIFQQKNNTNITPAQLLTVMPAAVRLQQLTPIVRPNTANQPTTIVRFISPTTSSGQQQTQPLFIKAISTQNSNRQQQPILLTTNNTQNTMIAQGQQQLLVLPQSALSSAVGQQPKLTLQITPTDVKSSETNSDSNVPQLDGSIDELDTSSSPSQSTKENTSNTKAETHEESLSTDKFSDNQDPDGWNIVGSFKTTTIDIKHYYVLSSKLNCDSYDVDELQVNQLVKRVDLEPGTIYKLRVAAVNSCGRGPWSEAAAFKTCVPGAPPAPSNIRIAKTSDGGAQLTWDPPLNTGCSITGYAVYLAVKNNNSNDAETARPNLSQMAFVRVYGGIQAECSVNSSQLQQAHLDVSSSGKPAIIFRIAAQNKRGYGPATQVRWLQDQHQVLANQSAGNSNNLKRSTSTSSTTKKQRLTVNNNGSNES